MWQSASGVNPGDRWNMGKAEYLPQRNRDEVYSDHLEYNVNEFQWR